MTNTASEQQAFQHFSTHLPEGGIHCPSQAAEPCGIAHAGGARLFIVSVLNQNTMLESSPFLCNYVANFNYAVSINK